MKLNGMQTNVVTAVVTAGVLSALAWAGGVFKAGDDALTEQQIEAVLAKVMVTDAGVTYAASLNAIGLSIASIDTNIGAIKEDIDDLENAVGALAAE